MAPQIPPGKLPVALLRELLASLPPPPPEVRLGPAAGEDACAIDVPGGTLVVATDPITLTGAGVGRHAVIVNANDVAVMGVRPRWFLAAVLLPPETDEAAAREVFASLSAGAREAGVTLVGGHTEVTEAVRRPVVVGQMLGLAEDRRFVPTGGARPGDAIVQAGAAPVEAAVVLAEEARERLAAIGVETLARALAALREPGISVVEAALAAAELGATALHDPTEGGLATGLAELAAASGVALRIDPERVLWFEPGRAVCRALDADPWGALASGALLAAFPPERAAPACESLERRGIPAHVIGRAEPGRGVTLAGGGALPEFAQDEVARVLAADAATREG